MRSRSQEATEDRESRTCPELGEGSILDHPPPPVDRPGFMVIFTKVDDFAISRQRAPGGAPGSMAGIAGHCFVRKAKSPAGIFCGPVKVKGERFNLINLIKELRRNIKCQK